ncbi:Long-chain-alcohol oxidase [Vigna angularis]|uniref:Long-chain-alcohol oxidase n=1 Tax=Phaseolus angularis TaxID=3914 RepID=A0A8T0K0P0_PHAAN|nr:Long-chain-alcohol oxidase [Vigna angularis]
MESPLRIIYKLAGVDEKNLQKGIDKVLRILVAAGAKEIGTHHNKGRTLNVKQVSYHEFEKFVKEESSRPLADLSTPLCSAHQMGSCRMGSNLKQSVVNETRETWEMEGLYVADTIKLELDMLSKKIEVKEVENVYLNESIERMDKELQQIKGANCRLSHQVKNSENLLDKDLELLEMIKRLRAVETLNEEFCRYIEKLNMD